MIQPCQQAIDIRVLVGHVHLACIELRLHKCIDVDKMVESAIEAVDKIVLGFLYVHAGFIIQEDNVVLGFTYTVALLNCFDKVHVRSLCSSIVS